MKRVWGPLLVVAVGALPVWGAERGGHDAAKPAPTPEDITRAKWDAVLAVLRDPKLDVKAREAAVERIASPVMDFALMAKLALGRTHWGRFSPAQRARYLKAFVTRLKSMYRERIAAYKGQEVRYAPRQGGSPGKDKTAASKPAQTGKTRRRRIVRVPIKLVSEDTTIAILHKFRKSGTQWKIYDIEIEGVSILLTYRSQFNDVLGRGTPEDLLSRLEQAPPD